MLVSSTTHFKTTFFLPVIIGRVSHLSSSHHSKAPLCLPIFIGRISPLISSSPSFKGTVFIPIFIGGISRFKLLNNKTQHQQQKNRENSITQTLYPQQVLRPLRPWQTIL
jgi:hypothetical protein